ncbi:MAG TPA: xanthine dehydrogenase family protein molybdopterin-binding subunit [Nocardioidaceae bacterium]|nr:xanthine dehydrogenase family protein molybdopterin-binding subunit [Nocardioidaceae bacterium]
MGTAVPRQDGPDKVRGTATYAYEQQVERPTYLHAVQATVPRGRIVDIDTSAAEALPGVVAVLTHRNAPKLADTDDRELAVLQDDVVSFRGELIGAVIAETPEVAREAAGLVRIHYDTGPHDTVFGTGRDDFYDPASVDDGFGGNADEGDVEAALREAEVVVDQTYTTPREHNNPMEPHSSIAVWSPSGDGPTLTLYDSTQGVHVVRSTIAPVLGLPEDEVRVVAPYVGGGFGSKGLPHAHNVLVAMAAQLTEGRPVKFAMTRQQMFALAGYRTPTIQRIRLGAGRDGRLTALWNEVYEQSSTVKEFDETSGMVSRYMYGAGSRRVQHHMTRLDVPISSWMRAPGEMPGMVAPEIAIDELACALDIDPIELRLLNEPPSDPKTGKPWSVRRLSACLRAGADRFGWSARQAPGARRDGDWLVGLGVAASTYPMNLTPGSACEVSFGADGCYAVRIGAVDIGTGTWTALAQVAADALEVPLSDVRLEIGDTSLPSATVEGGSSGLASWGSTVVAAARAFRSEHGPSPAPGASARCLMPSNPLEEEYSMHSFGAQFAEVRVHVDTGEVRVPRMLGVFSVGRVVNPATARSQLIGGMVWGLSAALLEEGYFDHHTGHVVNQDLSDYHVASNADVLDVDAIWLDESDPHSNPMGLRGIGEIGIVGSPAALVNAVHNATGIRVRDLPITPDKLLR